MYIYKNILRGGLITTLLYLLAFLIFTIRYATNDDVFLNFYSSGVLNGSPTELLVYYHFILGLILKYLYIVFPYVNWYSALLLFVHFSSSWYINYNIIKLGNNLRSSIVFILLLFFSLDIFLIIKLQYTSTAMKAASVGFLSLFMSSYAGIKMSKSRFIIVGYFLVVAYFIRSQALLGIILISLPVFGYLFLQSRDIKIIISYFFIALFIIAAKFTQNIYYENKTSQKELFEYVAAQEVLQNDPLNVKKEYLNEIGWSQNDFYLMNRNWFFVDPVKYTPENFSKLSQSLYKRYSIDLALKEFFNGINNYKRYLFMASILLILILFFSSGKIRNYVLICTGGLIGIYFYLAMFKRMNERVIVPLFFFTLLLGVYLYLWENNRINLPDKRKVLLKITLIILLAIGLIYQMYALKVTNQKAVDLRADFYDAYDDLVSLNEYLVIIPGGAFPYEGYPLFVSPNRYILNNLVPTSWTAQTPPFNLVKEYHNLSNLTLDIVEIDHILLHGIDTTYFKLFVKENYDISIEYAEIDFAEFKYLEPVYLINKK